MATEGVAIAGRRDAQRRDLCPECGEPRLELVVAPGRFYCARCEVAGPGPNEDAPDGAQLALEVGP